MSDWLQHPPVHVQGPRGAAVPGEPARPGQAPVTQRTAQLGVPGDPGQGVVDELGRCHDLENLFIADTGVFPRCTSVNPMFTGMALAHRTAGAVAEQL